MSELDYKVQIQTLTREYKNNDCNHILGCLPRILQHKQLSRQPLPIMTIAYHQTYTVRLKTSVISHLRIIPDVSISNRITNSARLGDATNFKSPKKEDN